MGDRAALISLFVNNGVSDPKVMRRLYDDGGDTEDIKPAIIEASYPREREVLDLVNNSKADFVSRLTDENRLTIPDWRNKDYIATHKLSYAKDGDRWVIYPVVQNIDGKLYDFSDPQYGLDKGWQALDSALYSGDYVEVPSEADARWFTESYKRRYPGFNKYKDGGDKNGDVDAISGADVPPVDTDPQKSKASWFDWWYKFRNYQIDNLRKDNGKLLTSKNRFNNDFLNTVHNRTNNVSEAYNDVYGTIDAPAFVNAASDDSTARKQILDIGRDYKSDDFNESAKIANLIYEGVYTPYYNNILYSVDNGRIPSNVMVHERTHALRDAPYYPTLGNNMLKYYKSGNFINSGERVDAYLDDDSEIYSRLNEFRYANNLNPSHTYSKDEISKFRKSGALKKYKLDRYTDDFVYFLLNCLADSGESIPNKSGVNSAALGGLFNKHDGKTEKSQKMVRLGKDDYFVPEELKPSVVVADSKKEKITTPIYYFFPERDNLAYNVDTLRDVMKSIVNRDKNVRNNPIETLKGYNREYRNPFIANPYYRNYVNYGYNRFGKGGDTIDDPRVDYIMKDLPLRAAVYDLSKQYGVSPAAIFYRLGREGAVDAKIRERDNIGNGNQLSLIDSLVLDEYGTDDAFRFYGLDDVFERYKKGLIKPRRKIPFAFGVAKNENGRLTSSVDNTFNTMNQYDMLELMVSELESFRNKAKKAYPGKDEDWYDRAAVTGYNRGTSFINWLKTNEPYDISEYGGITDSGYKSNNAKQNTIDIPYGTADTFYDDIYKVVNTVGPMLPSGKEMKTYNFLKSIGVKDSDMLDYESLNKALVTEPDITEPITYTKPYLNTGYKFMRGGSVKNK